LRLPSLLGCRCLMILLTSQKTRSLLCICGIHLFENKGQLHCSNFKHVISHIKVETSIGHIFLWFQLYCCSQLWHLKTRRTKASVYFMHSIVFQDTRVSLCLCLVRLTLIFTILFTLMIVAGLLWQFFLVCLAFCFVYLLYCFIPAQHDTLLIIFVPFYCVLAVARGRWLQNMLHLIQLGLTICVTII
jgi:hypothetical protein